MLRCASGRVSRWAAALCLSHAAAAAATDVQWTWAAEAGQRTLTERSVSGERLVREHGPMARVRLGATLQREGGSALAAQVALARGRLDYDGQTQAGQAASTTARHADAQWGLMWRPLPGAPWGEIWLSLDALRARREIAPGNAAGGLVERSTLVLPGIRWRGPAWAPAAAGGATVRADVQWRASVRHRLHVDYLGAYDGSALEGGRRHELQLGAELASAPWTWSVRWSRASEPASAAVPVYRTGSAVGTVRQPATRIDELSLSLARSF